MQCGTAQLEYLAARLLKMDEHNAGFATFICHCSPVKCSFSINGAVKRTSEGSSSADLTNKFQSAVPLGYALKLRESSPRYSCAVVSTVKPFVALQNVRRSNRALHDNMPLLKRQTAESCDALGLDAQEPRSRRNFPKFSPFRKALVPTFQTEPLLAKLSEYR